jgi:hypothetical protein
MKQIGASYDPETITVLRTALDDTWADLTGQRAFSSKTDMATRILYAGLTANATLSGSGRARQWTLCVQRNPRAQGFRNAPHRMLLRRVERCILCQPRLPELLSGTSSLLDNIT